MTLNAPDGLHVFPAAPTTAVFVNSGAASFCTLSHYLGSEATVWVTASGDQLLAGRVDVFGVGAPVGPEPVPGYGVGPYYGPYYGPYFFPFFGIGVDVGRGFDDRDFHRDGDFHRDRDFRGGDRGGSRGSGMNGGFHGARMNGASRGGGHGAGRR